MHLPGRLKATTLGDLLGGLHRERMSGTLELIEASGRTHRVYLSGGLVTAVELDRASASLGEVLRREDLVDEDTLRRSLLRALASRRLHGEVLIRDFHLSPTVIGRALRQQLMLRLQILEELSDAQIFYRAAVRTPRGALVDEPLAPAEFLAGKRRARDRDVDPASGTFRSSYRPPARPIVDRGRASAYRTLGLSADASTDEIKRAYRRLVRTYHPDLHPDANHDERQSLSARFAEVTAAYRALVA